jgi:hypothetical protein
MMELTPETRLNSIIEDASYHQDDRNKPQVCYGLKYPTRMMHSFLFGRLLPLEGVELDDGKGNGSARENVTRSSPYYWRKGVQSIGENWTCKIESNKPDDTSYLQSPRGMSLLPGARWVRQSGLPVGTIYYFCINNKMETGAAVQDRQETTKRYGSSLEWPNTRIYNCLKVVIRGIVLDITLLPRARGMCGLCSSSRCCCC